MGLRVIKAPLDKPSRTTVRTENTIGPAQVANRFKAFGIIDEILDIDHCEEPDWKARKKSSQHQDKPGGLPFQDNSPESIMSLDKLEDLDRDLQFAAIKEKHQKELLVAMREATSNENFDAILEDEFRGISDAISRTMYLTVCCFYQHGAYIRDELLASLLDLSTIEMYDQTNLSTEGVVVFDLIDASKGLYAARARHRVIASVIWERCGDRVEKDHILQKTLDSLNLNYLADKNAFDNFVRSDRIVDSIQSLDGKIRFFETACRKDPISPYVRQHYARMLSREGNAELALDQIDKAIKIDGNIKALHHTKGVVLSRLALSIESEGIARRRLAQSEASYQKVLSMYKRDEYSYQGLAQLYIGWAKRISTVSERMEYLSKAEEIISEGLKKVRARDSLWIESSRIQEFLGDHPSHVEDLEKAVRDTPGSIIGRYLLGRAYRKDKRYQDAKDVLDPVIKNHQDEFRAFVEYALAILYLNKDYKESIAVLNLSTLYGLSDPRFIATLGGMTFMNLSFTDANIIFDESSKNSFIWDELHSVQFRPPNFSDMNDFLRLKGKVTTVKSRILYDRIIFISSTSLSWI